MHINYTQEGTAYLRTVAHSGALGRIKAKLLFTNHDNLVSSLKYLIITFLNLDMTIINNS